MSETAATISLQVFMICVLIFSIATSVRPTIDATREFIINRDYTCLSFVVVFVACWVLAVVCIWESPMFHGH